MEWLPSVLSLVAIVFSFMSFAKTNRFKHYQELDHMYFDILAIAVKFPRFRTPPKITDEEERLAYGAYAYIVWNFIETVYDRCFKDPSLWKTWEPAFKVESELHRAWFEDSQNAPGFKVEFREFVKKRFSGSRP